jgi:hypothetical protein
MTYTSLMFMIFYEGFDRSPMFNGRIKVLVQGIVRLLKIRLTVSLTKRGISFL